MTIKRYCAKFRVDRSNRCEGMAVFRFLNMAVIRHLGFLKVGNFTCRAASESQYVSSCNISRRSVKPFQRYAHISIFRYGGCPPSWISFTRVWTTNEKYLVVFMTVQILVSISAVISIICMHVLIFCTLSLKIPIHVPKTEILGIWFPKWRQYERDPKRHFLSLNHVVWRIDIQIGPPVRARCEPKNRAKNLKYTKCHDTWALKSRDKVARYYRAKKSPGPCVIALRNQTGDMTRVRPDHPRCRSATRICVCATVWSYPRCSYIFKVS